jgi:membrane protein required for colicin V production
MNAFDIILLVILVVSFVGGLAKGLVREVFSLAGVVVGILVALLFASPLADELGRWISYESAAYAAALVLLFVITMVVAGLLGIAITKVIDLASLGFMNRLLGGAFGLVRAFLIGLVLALGLTLFLDTDAPLLRDSRFIPDLAVGARVLAPLLPEGPRHVLLDRLDILESRAPTTVEI